MSETIIAAIIGVLGTIFVVIVTVITQFLTTKALIKAERQKIKEQIRREEVSRFKEKRHDRILDAISELLIVSDPQSTSGVDYGRTVNLVLRIQLMLDTTNAEESTLNIALNDLASSLQEYFPVRTFPIDQKVIETKGLLQAQDLVIRSSKFVLKNIQLIAT